MFKGFQGRYVGADIDAGSVAWIAANLRWVQAGKDGAWPGAALRGCGLRRGGRHFRFHPQERAGPVILPRRAPARGPDAPRASASNPTSRPLLAVRIIQILRHMLDPLRRLG